MWASPTLVQISSAAGHFSAGAEEPNALVELRSGARREPNTKATTVELYDGLEAASQNRWPSLAFDVHAINQACGSRAGCRLLLQDLHVAGGVLGEIL
jgi:NADPH-dependent 2,4-dienoyl-CoA reductase/sulfur reductase-like enzyme